MPRRSVGATVQWTESQSAAHGFEEGAIIEHPDNPNALMFAAEGTEAARIVQHPSNSTSLLVTRNTSADPDAIVLMAGGGGFVMKL